MKNTDLVRSEFFCHCEERSNLISFSSHRHAAIIIASGIYSFFEKKNQKNIFSNDIAFAAPG